MTAVKYRQSLIQSLWKGRLHKYITGIIQNNGHKVLAINSMPDHMRLFIGLRPNQSISDLMRIVKSESSEWVNMQQFTPTAFRWQEGHGAFSYSKSQVQTVTDYVLNQEEHHKKKTFLEEYDEFLKLFEIEYDDKYIFTSPE